MQSAVDTMQRQKEKEKRHPRKQTKTTSQKDFENCVILRTVQSPSLYLTYGDCLY